MLLNYAAGATYKATGNTAPPPQAPQVSGTLFGWGSNEYGVLGVNDMNVVDASSPVQIGAANNWVGVYRAPQLDLGYTKVGSHAAGVRKDGTLWMWGDNTYGQIGDGTVEFRSSPVQVSHPTGSKWTKAALGINFTLAIDENKKMWSWGNNDRGQLGTELRDPTPSWKIVSVPRLASSFPNPHALAIKTDGTLWGWGSNESGQLGDGTYNQARAPILITATYNGNPIDEWVHCEAGPACSFAIGMSYAVNNQYGRDYLLLFGWGGNGSNCLGSGGTPYFTPSLLLEDILPGATSFSVGGSDEYSAFWMAIKYGTLNLWTAGNNNFGQLGIQNIAGTPTPMQVDSNQYVCVSCGDAHTAAVAADGSAWTWGSNSWGQLGITYTTGGSGGGGGGGGTRYTAFFGSVFQAYDGFAYLTMFFADATSRDTAMVAVNGTTHVTWLGDFYSQITNMSGTFQIPLTYDPANVQFNDYGPPYAPYGLFIQMANADTATMSPTPITNTIEVASSVVSYNLSNVDWGGPDAFIFALFFVDATQAQTFYDSMVANNGGTFNINGVPTYSGYQGWSYISGTATTTTAPDGFNGSVMWWFQPHFNLTPTNGDPGPSTLTVSGSTSRTVTISGYQIDTYSNIIQLFFNVESDLTAFTTAVGTNAVTISIAGPATQWSPTGQYVITTAVGGWSIPSPTVCYAFYTSSTPQLPTNVADSAWGSVSLTYPGSSSSSGVPVNIASIEWVGDYGTLALNFVAQTDLLQALNLISSGQYTSFNIDGAFDPAIGQNITGTVSFNTTAPDSMQMGPYQILFYSGQYATNLSPATTVNNRIVFGSTSSGSGGGSGGGGGPVTYVADTSPSMQVPTRVLAGNTNNTVAAFSNSFYNVACGVGYTMFVYNDMTPGASILGLYSVGRNAEGALGLPNSGDTYQPTIPVLSFDYVANYIYTPYATTIQAGATCTTLSTEGGYGYYAGNCMYGTTNGSWFFTPGGGGVGYGKWKSAPSPNYWSVVGVTKQPEYPDQVIMYCGYNLGGIWGIGDSNDWNSNFTSPAPMLGALKVAASSPVAVGGDTSTITWNEVTAGNNYTVAISSTNQLYAWGDSATSQTGNLTYDPVYSPTMVGDPSASWKQVSIIADATNIAIGLQTDGSLWTWGGQNIFGDITGGPTYNTWAQPMRARNPQGTSWAILGDRVTAAIDTTGSLWAWGQTQTSFDYNTGQHAGYPTAYRQTTPALSWTQLVSTNMGCVNADGFFSSFGSRGTAAGITSDGALYVWGQDGGYGSMFGQNWVSTSKYGAYFDPWISLPQKYDNHSWTQVSISNKHLLAIRSDGTLWGSGHSRFGQVGVGALGDIISTPTQIGTSSWTMVAAGTHYSHGIKADGTLWFWGRSWGRGASGANEVGSDAYGGTLPVYNGDAGVSSPVQVGTANNWAKIFATGSYIGGIGGWDEDGRQSTFAIKTDGTLWAWGANHRGQLGDGTFIDRSSPVQIGIGRSWITVSSGGDQTHMASLKSIQYGLSNEDSMKVATVAIRSDGLMFTWGDNFNRQLGTNGSQTVYSWSQLTSGKHHALGIKSDGSLWAWGANQRGQLGDGTNQRRHGPVKIGNSSWTQVAAGGMHSLAINAAGQLFVWGSNIHGATGGASIPGGQSSSSPVQITSIAKSWTQIAAGYRTSYGITTLGELYGWGEITGAGNSTTSPVRVGTSSWTAVASDPAGSHALAIRSDGTLWSWGNNAYGQLGNGTTSSVFSPVQVNGSGTWTKIAAGRQHSAGIKSDGTLWTWGSNTYGQLGINGVMDPTENNNNGWRSYPAQVGTSNSWVAVGAYAYNTVGIRANMYFNGDRILFGWGSGQYRMNADPGWQNYTIPYRLGQYSYHSKVTTGPFSIMSDGTATVWGSGCGTHPEYGTLGTINGYNDTAGGEGVGLGLFPVVDSNTSLTFATLGTQPDAYTVSPVQVSACTYTQCTMLPYGGLALRSDNKLVSWGLDAFNTGVLGTNEITMLGHIVVSTPTVIDSTSTYTAIPKRFDDVGVNAAIKNGGALMIWGAEYMYYDFGKFYTNNAGVNSPYDSGYRSSPVAYAGQQVHTALAPFNTKSGSWTQVGAYSGIKADGTLWVWDTATRTDTIPAAVSTVVQVGTANTWAQISTTVLGFGHAIKKS